MQATISPPSRTEPGAPRLPVRSGIGVSLLRLVVIYGFVLSTGGFTVYGGLVVPILDDHLGASVTGTISREVTDGLNLLTGVSLVPAWLLVWWERGRGRRILAWPRLGSLAIITLTLAGLVWLHIRMGTWLDTVGTSGFKPWHRMYLGVSTLQWGANLLFLATSVVLWGDRRGRDDQ